MKRVLLVLAVAAGTVLAAAPVGAEPAVDADRYRTDGGDYAFSYRYDGSTRACTIATDPTIVRCAVSAPAGTRITVQGRSVRPEAIELTERSWRYLDRRPSDDRHRSLPEGARISVHGASCTVPRGGGLECEVESVGFRQEDGRFATHGRKTQ